MHPTRLASSRGGQICRLTCVCLLSLFHAPIASAQLFAPGDPEPTPEGLGRSLDGPNLPVEPTPESDQPEVPEEEESPPAPPPPNRAPAIGGVPPTDLYAGDRYTFTPTARDPDSDALTFSIVNKPAWAAFDTRTGRLDGTPTNAHVGEFTGILISVSDGEDIARLDPFSILVRPIRTGSVSLSWQPPTQREDGSALTDLAGYRLLYGRQPGVYTDEVRIRNPGITRYVVDDLAAGTWYFVMTAFDADGLESDFSEEAVRSVTP